MDNPFIKTLKSKVANRIFWLIFVSACIPLLTIFLISYNYLSDKLEQDTSQEIYRESRSSGLLIYDRLLLMESSLKVIEKSFEQNPATLDYFEDDWISEAFESVFTVSVENNEYIKLPTSDKKNYFNELQKQHLKSKTLLLVQDENSGHRFLLIRRINNQIVGDYYLVGQISNDYLFNLGIHIPDVLTILNQNGSVIYSTVDYSGESQRSIKNLKLHEHNKKNIKYLELNDQMYAINGWSLFLKARFASENFIISYSTPKRATYSTSTQFKYVFPQTLVVTALLIALISITQIRRSLGPISKLVQATKNISHGIYDRPVHIGSGDEFEKLGDSFNDMTHQLRDQFNTLEKLSQIDRLILSSMGRESILNTLIQYLSEIVEVNHIGILTISDEENLDYEMLVNSDDSFLETESLSSKMSLNEIRELQTCTTSLSFDNTETRSYTKQQNILGDKHYLVLPLTERDEIIGLICISSKKSFDISEHKFTQLKELSERVTVALSNAAWEEKLYTQAHYDSLTNLPNRYLFKDRLEQAIESAKRNERNVVVMFVDLDRFKNINDSLGHSIGDQVIKKTADLLLHCVRKYDTVSRFAGDEFLIILPDIKSLDLAIRKSTKVASRILERMSYSFKVGDRNIYMSASIGLTVVPRDSDDFETILINADTAMYKAKSKGRNTYEFFSSDDKQDNLDKLNLESELRHALSRNQLTLVFQPKVDLNKNEVVGVESLVRWNHPQLGYISPNKFISIAEDAGLISDIGFWVLENACNYNKKWQEEHRIKINTSINVSTRQFKQTDFFDRVYEIINESGVSPRNIELEITESITMENIDATKKILDEIRELGVMISIDDFGTGYSSLSYLQQFPIDYLKIDQTFIRDIPFNKSNLSIVKSIIALAHNMEMKAIAEGVETKEQYKLMEEVDCDYVQGYLICNPVTSKAFIEFYKERKGTYKLEDAGEL